MVKKAAFEGGNQLHGIHHGPTNTSSYQDDQQYYQQKADCELKRRGKRISLHI